MLWQVYTAPFYIADAGNTTVTAVSYAPDRPPMYSEPVTRTYSLQAAACPPICAASALYADVC